MSLFTNALGRAKRAQICVPIVGKSREEILTEASIIKRQCPDLIEWRVDKLGFKNFTDLEPIARELKGLLVNIPMLFTWRSHREGGEEISDKDYLALANWAIASGFFPAVDIELSIEKANCKGLAKLAKEHGAELIFSYHNFALTPDILSMTNILEKGRALGGVPKMAVMPQNKRDVIRLMEVILLFKEKYPSSPVIGISMGELGQITRAASNFFGSVLTFALGVNASAPGQLSVEQVKSTLEIIE